MEKVTQAIQAVAAGKLVIVIDDQNRENEGDLIIAAEKATPATLAFMVRYTSGIICMPMMEKRLNELYLPQMVSQNTDVHQTAFTVSVDYKPKTTTGISAEDRTATILALINGESNPHDFSRPGHIFPLRYREGGVLKRAGHTEAAVDLARLACLYPAAVIGEIMNDDGSVARLQDLKQFAEKHDLLMISIADIIRYRQKKEKLVRLVSQALLPTKHGTFTAYVYLSDIDGIEHIALVKGHIANEENVLVRVHSECLTGDVFGSCRCDCGTQLDSAMSRISEAGKGVIVYLRGHEGRGIGLGHKIMAYHLQDKGRDTVEANMDLGLPVDSREYGIGAQILTDLGLSSIKLLTNNPTKFNEIASYDLTITERIPLLSQITKENSGYLKTKKDKLGHYL